MIKKLMLFGVGIFPLLLQAQVTISAQLPPAGLVQQDQLWYLVLSNSKEDILDVNIKMNLQDASTGQIVMSANSGSFLLSKGIKIITSRDIQPISYNYNSVDFSRSYLPMGSYIACYQVYHVGQKGEEPLGDECLRINIDPLSPPLLNTPADKSEVQSPYPQFTWMPPTPIDMFSNLSYEILVTEVLPGQSSTEAIQYNTPVYTNSNISQTYESYPSSFSSLDTGKVYAWQVIAKNGLSYAARTEVWTFKLKKENSKREPPNGNYILLNNEVVGTYTVKRNVLHIKYVSSSMLHETSIIFSDSENDKPIKKVWQKIQPGDNYFDLDISKEFQPGRIYKITITDLAKKQHSLRFSISKN